jgi:hypothetical protein
MGRMKRALLGQKRERERERERARTGKEENERVSEIELLREGGLSDTRWIGARPFAVLRKRAAKDNAGDTATRRRSSRGPPQLILQLQRAKQ